MSNGVHAEAQRLLSKGMKLCPLHPMSKKPMGDEWQLNPVTRIEPGGGYGLPLAVNGLCSIDPDNVEPARAGMRRCGFDLDEVMNAGVRTTSTRPGSGGRSTFRAPAGPRWIKFSTKANGTILELRANSTNLQDCLPGTVYLTSGGAGPFEQQYANGRRLDDAPELPPHLLAWWLRLSEDVDYLREQQKLFCGDDAQVAVSSGDGNLAFASPLRVEYNAAHDVPTILSRHKYTSHTRGRWAPPTATGEPGIRAIPGRTGLWQSDHASDPLHGTFDAWTAYVVLDHDGDVQAAEAAWEPVRRASLTDGFTHVAVNGASGELLPAFKRDLKSGEIKATKENTVMALARPDLCGFKLRCDSFRGELMIAAHNTDGWRSFKDTDYLELCMRLERGKFQSIGKELRRDAVAYVGEKNVFDSAQHWLDGLTWDGAPRVERSLITYFGAADTAYARAVAMYLFTALAGRVIEPAVKCDMVPVAVGAQGMRKSSAVAALVPSDEFFIAIDLGAKDTDLARLIRGKLVIELGELIGLRAREVEHIKAFVTRRFEEWTPKFVEMNTRYPRRCVFFGTSNKDDFLVDETGNRRWLPFRCGMCDPNGIARDREQLWAEARDLFTQHGVLYQQAEQLAEAEHAGFTEHDDWEDVVQDWLSRPDYDGTVPGARDILRSGEVLKHAIGLSDAMQTRPHQQRIKKVLLRLGYTEASKRVNGQKVRGYAPPSLFE
jgi:hypothetical protein